MTALELLRKELEETLDAHKESVAYGHAKDYAEYRHNAGVIIGLTSALERVKDLQRYQEEN
jgi:hypothetical protein